MSIGIVCNAHRETYAMPGWLEMATAFFDDVCVVSSPPSDAEPDEETIELVEKAGVRLVHTTIDEGYGVVRTRCIRECKADWCLITDADERFLPVVPIMRCEGSEKYPDTLTPNLSVHVDIPKFDQGKMLREMVASAGSNDAIRLCRRHWFDEPGSLTKPCQNWHHHPDWQLRLIRNSQFMFYLPERKLHEHLKDSRTWAEPSWSSGDTTRGPFIDHFHHWAKSRDPEGRKLAVATYEKLDKRLTDGMWSKVGFNDEIPKVKRKNKETAEE